jgi:hypothetical protein
MKNPPVLYLSRPYITWQGKAWHCVAWYPLYSSSSIVQVLCFISPGREAAAAQEVLIRNAPIYRASQGQGMKGTLKKRAFCRASGTAPAALPRA